MLGLKLGEDGRTVIDASCEMNAYPTITLEDLNDDGSPEVFVQAGNVCNSGFTGSSLWLFIRDSAGRLQANFGFAALGYRRVGNQVQGFPDLELGGPGFCHPVWHWDGTGYVFLRRIEEQPGGCVPPVQ